LLREFLGLDYEFITTTGEQIQISLIGDSSGRSLLLPDTLFQTPPAEWLSPQSCPQTPLPRWELPSELKSCCLEPSLPVIYGENQDATPEFWKEDSQGIRWGIDVFGSAFFLLTRYEEVAQHTVRDQHDRFPLSASLAGQEGFLHRPIVNEYLEILRFSFQKLWPQLELKLRQYRVFLSHDIDRPLSARGRNAIRLVRSLARDVIERKDLALAVQRYRSHWKQTRGNFKGSFECDPNNTFDFLMTQSEQHGLKSAFFFLSSGKSDDAINANYDLSEPWLLEIYRQIHQRGHEIGLHPGYGTYLDAARTEQEFEDLKMAVAKAGIEQEEWGGRQHYLRWKNPQTWQNWDDAGLAYDSSLGFAERPGFRSGTCYEFPVFNLQARQALRLRERPLIVMETSVLNYMNLTREQAFEEIKSLNTTCRRFSGDFTLLWHNDSLLGKAQKGLYSDIVQQIAACSMSCLA
jgi:hypothetical protein